MRIGECVLSEIGRCYRPAEKYSRVMGTSSPRVSVRCQVRKSSLVAPLDATFHRLEELAADGVVDELTVGAWPARVRLGDPGPHSEAVARFEEYDAWADQWDVRVRPPFAVETRHSEITDETREVLVTPVQCLAVYVDGALREVFPHTTGQVARGETYTVRDGLSLLDEYGTHLIESGQHSDVPPGHPVLVEAAVRKPIGG